MKRENVILYLLFASMLFNVFALSGAFKNEDTVVNASYDPGTTQHWVKVGTGAPTLRMQPTKILHVRVTPTSASGTVDISALGLTTIIDKQISAQRNATDVQIAFKSVSTTSIAYNLTQSNTAVVSILGINVLSGLPLIGATDLSNIEINIEITGY